MIEAKIYKITVWISTKKVFKIVWSYFFVNIGLP